MLKTISLVLTDESRDAPALDAAIALAQRLDAHLDLVALGVEPVPMEVVPMMTSQVVLETGRAEAEAQAKRLADWAESQLPAGLRATVTPQLAQNLLLTTEAALAARFADLVVAARPYGRGHAGLAPAVVEGLLFGTTAPVLVVPDKPVDVAAPFRRPCLAWNGSDEAIRAARAALPFLQEAGEVEVAIVAPPLHGTGRSDPGVDLAQWLDRQGVKAEISVLAKTEPKVGDILGRFAREKGCDLLVMGAFGHSRLREVVLGGATRDLLATVPLPLLLAR